MSPLPCRRDRFPRLYAAASLKLREMHVEDLAPPQFSAALCRGLIEAESVVTSTADRLARFPRLYAAASLKPGDRVMVTAAEEGFPRLYAAASLKQHRGPSVSHWTGRFPRLYAAASLKQGVAELLDASTREVFRGFMPRPH